MGTGDLVRRQGLVDVDEDTRVLRAVQLRAQGAAGEAVCSGARDLEVDALRVVLGAADLVGGVQRDRLVAQDVFAWSDARRDRHGPRASGADHVVRCPVARGRAAVDEAGLVDLGELQLALVDAGAIAAAGGQVVHHRAVVGFGPVGPFQLDASSGRHGDI